MNYYIIPAALLATLGVTVLFSLFLKRPFSAMWLFFLLVFLATWAGQLWIMPFGPVFYGISWVPLIGIAVFFGLIMVALSPGPVTKRNTENEEAEQEAFLALGAFLWVILVIFIIIIATGYYRSIFMIT